MYFYCTLLLGDALYRNSPSEGGIFAIQVYLEIELILSSIARDRQPDETEGGSSASGLIKPIGTYKAVAEERSKRYAKKVP